jgi:hypothetical protein
MVIQRTIAYPYNTKAAFKESQVRIPSRRYVQIWKKSQISNNTNNKSKSFVWSHLSFILASVFVLFEQVGEITFNLEFSPTPPTEVVLF